MFAPTAKALIKISSNLKKKKKKLMTILNAIAELGNQQNRK